MNKDYRVNIKVRNNRLIEAIEESGGQLGGKWCKANNLNYTRVNDLIRLKASPLAANKIDLSTTAAKLCEVLNKSPNELWSDDLIHPLVQNDIAVKLSAPELKQIVQYHENEPDKLFAISEMQDKVNDVVNDLDPREKEVIKMLFFDEYTLEEVGERFDVTRERVRQIEARALRKLRHPKKSEELKSYLGEL